MSVSSVRVTVIMSVLGLMTVTVSPVTVPPMTVSVSHTAIKKGMTVAMTFITMRVSVSSVLKNKYSNKIHQQSCY